MVPFRVDGSFVPVGVVLRPSDDWFRLFSSRDVRYYIFDGDDPLQLVRKYLSDETKVEVRRPEKKKQKAPPSSSSSSSSKKRRTAR